MRELDEVAFDDEDAALDRAIERADRAYHAWKEEQEAQVGRTLMKCGHVAQGNRENPDGTRTPCCVICAGIGSDPFAYITPAPIPPDLTGRKAYCCYCKTETESSFKLPFFEFGKWERGVKNMDKDTYYCGCRGWD